MKKIKIILSTVILLMNFMLLSSQANAQGPLDTVGEQVIDFANDAKEQAVGLDHGIVNPVIGDLGGNQSGGIMEASSGSTFLRYFVTLWQAFINIGGLAVIIMFLWGAIEWIVAGGDSGKVQKARDRITQAMIGLVLLVGSFVIISYLGKVFFGDQFDILRFTLPTI